MRRLREEKTQEISERTGRKERKKLYETSRNKRKRGRGEVRGRGGKR